MKGWVLYKKIMTSSNKFYRDNVNITIEYKL